MYKHTYTHMCIGYIHTDKHTNIQAHIYTTIHTDTHTYKQAESTNTKYNLHIETYRHVMSDWKVRDPNHTL